MPLFTDELLAKYKLIDNTLRNFQDMIVTDNYMSAYKKLEPFRKEKEERQRFMNIATRLDGVPTDKIQPVKKVDTEGIDTNGYAVTELPNTEAWKTFTNAYKMKHPEWDGTSAIDMGEFNKYLGEFPGYKDELRQRGIIKPQQVETQKTDDEIRQDIYTLAGLQPEDVQFYNDYKKRWQETETHNQRLQDFVHGVVPYLNSPFGDEKKTAFVNQALGLAFEVPPAANYKWMEVNGKLVRINPITGKADVMPIDTGVKKKANMKDLTATDLKKLGVDELINNYSTDEIYSHLDDYDKAVRDKLLEMYPEWKMDDSTTGTGTRLSGRRRSGSTGRRRSGKTSLGNPFGDTEGDNTDMNSDNTDTGETDLDRRTKSAVKRNEEKYNRQMNSDIQQQRQELAKYMTQFKNEYEVIKRSKDKKAQQSWLNDLQAFLDDVKANFDPEVVDEALAYVKKYYGVDVR